MRSSILLTVCLGLILCAMVGCVGIIGSQKKFDRCGVCGGNDSSCHVISGIFTRTRLPAGYNRVTSVPKGACNINVSELVVSPNFLAIRLTDGSYVVNGDRDVIGMSGEFAGAGTVFHYRRAAPHNGQEAENDPTAVETIVAAGPLNASIDIMVVQEQENRGIMYTYTIPTTPIAENSPSHHQHMRHRNHGIRHHHQRPDHHRGASTVSTSETANAAIAPADQPASDAKIPSVSDVSSSHLSVADQGLQQQHQKGDNRRQAKTTRGSHQGEPSSPSSPSSSRHHQKQQRHHRQLSTLPPGDRVDNKEKRSLSTSNDDPLVDAEDSVNLNTIDSNSETPADGSPTVSRVLHGTNFALPVRQRYVQPGQVYGAPPHSYSAVGWPYTGQQVLSPYESPAVQYHQPNVLGNPYQVRTPYVQQQPYYLAPGHSALHDQQSAAGLVPSYDYYTGGGNRHRRIGSVAASMTLNDQFDDSAGNDDVIDYVWKIAGFTECSQTCGGGYQQTQVVCMKVTGTQVVVTDENCEPSLKPTVKTVTCSNTPCPPSWDPTEWSECSTTCDRGQQTRSIECRQKVSPTLSIAVSASRCLHLQRPETLRTCNDDRPCTRWKIGEWSQCSTECGKGQRSRVVTCVNVEDKQIAENKCDGPKPRMSEFCDMGSCARTWFYTNWSEECSNECGEGVYHRLVHCSADPQQCSELNRPKSEKPCKQERPCGGQWFTGPWSGCSVTCGAGVIQRDVVCMKRLGSIIAVVGEENCPEDEKPETEQECEQDPCEPRWYMTDWSECSRSCDTGLQHREVKCLDVDQLPSQSCNPGEKPELRQTCNVHPCSPPAASLSSNSTAKDSSGRGRSHHHRQRTPQAASSCQDQFKNCRVVVQARLCRFAYYKDVCCFSCISHDAEPVTSSTAISAADSEA